MTCYSPIACLLLFFSSALAAAQAPALDDHARQQWELANRAYLDGRNDAGHRLLKELIEQHPGEGQLAAACLTRIREEAGRNDAENPWVRYATRRLLALERMGVVSAQSETTRTAAQVQTKVLTQRGDLLIAVEEIRRLAAENPHDVFWRILEAELAQQTDDSQTRKLFAKLRAEMDLDHPDETMRQRWNMISQALKADDAQLPARIDPLPAGSPLMLKDLEDRSVRWQDAVARSPATEAGLFDRIAGQALMGNRILLWRDESGFTDPARALDLHLLSRPPEELAALRRVQAAALAREKGEPQDDAASLALFRRYPWADAAQRTVLEHANEALLAGRAQSALRSFHDVLRHAKDDKLLGEARVGYWAALSQLGESERLRAGIDAADPKQELKWLGEPATVAEISAILLKPIEPAEDDSIPAIDGLQLHAVRLPPVAPWPAEASSRGALVDLSVHGDDLIVSGRNLLARYDANEPGNPLWSQLQRHAAEVNTHTGFHAGYFRPVVADSLVYSRWGFTSAPAGIAAYDRETGKPLWSNAPPAYTTPHRRRAYHVPMGDPVLSDGLLYYLQWNALENIQHNRGRRLNLVCYDPHQRAVVWQHTIAEAGKATDLHASLERASAQIAVYGNQVTIEGGSIYSSSNAGIISRNDTRDGRTEWTHFYRQGTAVDGSLGAAPIVAGDRVICMPRDAGGRIFALDRRLGRLVWDNSLLRGVEMIGQADGAVIVRGQTTLAAVDIETGQVRWYRPLGGRAVGRTLLMGNAVYAADSQRLTQLNAATGHEIASRDWNLGGQRPHNFTIDKGKLYVVTDKPADNAREKLAQPLNPEANDSDELALPLRRAWTLPRTAASVSIPPADSPLSGRAYVLSGGVLECIDATPQGAIRWRRFVNTAHPTVSVMGEHVVLLDRPGGNAPGGRAYLTALNGNDGNTEWEVSLDATLIQPMECGTHIVCHDGRGKIAGIELTTGEMRWQRVLGVPQLMTVSWANDQLHVVYVSGERITWHLHLDPASGETIDHSRVEMGLKSGKTTNGKLVDGGYYEVSFEPTDARYLRLVCLSEINGRGWSSIAELHVVDENGENIPRSDWRVLRADNTETKTAYDTRPQTIFDNDPVTWWHTQWIGGIPNHPHEVHLDLGKQYKVRGIRYLPAVIINNNGMIRDYELYVSNDPNSWGEPSAKGYLVNRVRIERPVIADDAVYFEARNHQTNSWEVFRYGFDGQPARAIENRARIAGAGGPYLVVAAEGKNLLTLLRSDDPDYRFELTSEHPLHREGEIIIDGDRLILGRRSLVVADLVKQRFIVPPSPDNQPHNRSGVLSLTGKDKLFKVVHLGGEALGAFAIDLTTGEISQTKLAEQTEQARHLHTNHLLPQFEQVLFVVNNKTVTAYASK